MIYGEKPNVTAPSTLELVLPVEPATGHVSPEDEIDEDDGTATFLKEESRPRNEGAPVGVESEGDASEEDALEVGAPEGNGVEISEPDDPVVDAARHDARAFRPTSRSSCHCFS